MDYSMMSRKQLQEASDDARQELAWRQTEDVFRQQLADMQEQYNAAFDHPHVEGEKWRPQTYPLTAYCVGDVVFYNAAYYRSLIPGNQFSPDDRGWRLVDKDGAAKPWVQPKYDHDGYMTGEHALRGGREFVATTDHVMDEPTVGSDQWTVVNPGGEEPEEG